MASVMRQDEVAPAGNPSEMSLPLTFFDMPWLFYYQVMRRLIFYRLPNISRETFDDTIIPKLVSSLSLTLKHYLPMAGKLVSPSDSSAKPELRYVAGDSVSVTYAESGGDFNSLASYHPCEMNELYPFVPRLSKAKHTPNNADIVVPVLALQVTVFPGFGICIGTIHRHVAADANTLNSFIQEWGATCKVGGDEELISEKRFPFYDRTVVRDPYGLGDKMLEEMKKKFTNVNPSEAEISTPPKINKVRATYTMRRRDIEKLKNLVGPAAGRHVTAFSVTCAYIWTRLVKAKAAIGQQTEIEYFSCAANFRSRLNPPLPANYFGNCVVGCYAKSTHAMLVGSEGFVTAAELVGEAIQKRVNDEESILRGECFTEFEEACVLRTFGATGHLRMTDLYTADFGWGNPEKVEDVSADTCDCMTLCKSPHCEGDIEVRLSTSRAKMDAFAPIFAHGLAN